jgi:hypothetical protein
MKKDKHLSIRLTGDRNEQIEHLRQKLQSSGRELETIHGVVTTSAVIDEALKALDAQLSGIDLGLARIASVTDEDLEWGARKVRELQDAGLVS